MRRRSGSRPVACTERNSARSLRLRLGDDLATEGQALLTFSSVQTPGKWLLVIETLARENFSDCRKRSPNKALRLAGWPWRRACLPLQPACLLTSYCVLSLGKAFQLRATAASREFLPLLRTALGGEASEEVLRLLVENAALGVYDAQNPSRQLPSEATPTTRKADASQGAYSGV